MKTRPIRCSSSRVYPHCESAARAAGLTLVEMLVAMAASLLLLGLVAQLFSMVGQGVNGSRNAVEMADRTRTVQLMLRNDLVGATAFGLEPPLDPERNLGYFEIVEGPEHEYGRAFADPSKIASDDRLMGDCDDVLAFTTRATGDTFTGMLDANARAAMQSPYAEVIYFCRKTANTQNPQLCTLHRRQRLIVAYPGAGAFQIGNSALPGIDTDISCRLRAGRLIPNTLGDLTKRENRFLRDTAQFPYAFDQLRQVESLRLTGPREGEDVILTNVLAFDVRVFDIDAPLRRIGDQLLVPGDPGYNDPQSVSSSLQGGFVDLNWPRARRNGNVPVPDPRPEKGGEWVWDRAAGPGSFGSWMPAAGWFSGLGVSVRNSHPTRTLSIQPPGSSRQDYATYDTWSSHYEVNGLDDDGVAGVDQGTNGFDDAIGDSSSPSPNPWWPANNRVDDAREAETSPPYPVRLRGIEITIRCYEPAARQVREVKIRHAL